MVGHHGSYIRKEMASKEKGVENAIKKLTAILPGNPGRSTIRVKFKDMEWPEEDLKAVEQYLNKTIPRFEHQELSEPLVKYTPSKSDIHLLIKEAVEGHKNAAEGFKRLSDHLQQENNKLQTKLNECISKLPEGERLGFTQV